MKTALARPGLDSRTEYSLDAVQVSKRSMVMFGRLAQPLAEPALARIGHINWYVGPTRARSGAWHEVRLRAIVQMRGQLLDPVTARVTSARRRRPAPAAHPRWPSPAPGR